MPLHEPTDKVSIVFVLTAFKLAETRHINPLASKSKSYQWQRKPHKHLRITVQGLHIKNAHTTQRNMPLPYHNASWTELHLARLLPQTEL